MGLKELFSRGGGVAGAGNKIAEGQRNSHRIAAAIANEDQMSPEQLRDLEASAQQNSTEISEASNIVNGGDGQQVGRRMKR